MLLELDGKNGEERITSHVSTRPRDWAMVKLGIRFKFRLTTCWTCSDVGRCTPTDAEATPRCRLLSSRATLKAPPCLFPPDTSRFSALLNTKQNTSSEARMAGRCGHREELYTFVISNPASFLVSNVGVPCLALLPDYATINTTNFPRRKGVSNMPFVFTARGKIQLSPISLPPPNFAPLLKSKQATMKPKKALVVKSVPRRVSSLKSSRDSRRTLSDIEADGDSDSEFESSRPFDANHPFVTSNYDNEISSESEEEEGDSNGEEDTDAALNPYKWNEPEDAFEQYLAWFTHPHPPSALHPGRPPPSPPLLDPTIRPLPQHEIQVYPCTP